MGWGWRHLSELHFLFAILRHFSRAISYEGQYGDGDDDDDDGDDEEDDDDDDDDDDDFLTCCSE